MLQVVFEKVTEGKRATPQVERLLLVLMGRTYDGP